MKEYRKSICLLLLVLGAIMLFTACPTDSTGTTGTTAPEKPTVVAGYAKLTVSWAPVSGAISYNVYYNTSNSTAGATQVENATSPYEITGLANVTTYYVWLKAVYVNGSSDFSVVNSATTEQPKTITYDANQGTGDVPEKGSFAKGETATVADRGDILDGAIAKTGYIFTGWNTDSEGGGTAYKPNDTFIIDNDITLYAMWTQATDLTEFTINTFNNDDRSVYGIESYTGSSTEVIIPELKEGKPIEAIKANTFFNKTNLEKVTIPTTVEEIGNSAFSGCTGLTNVNITSSLKKIGSDAFIKCSLLKSIHLPESLESIGNNAFKESGLESAILPSTLTSENLGDNIFHKCKDLKNVILPESITVIKKYMFAECESLEAFPFHDGITEIQDYAFFIARDIQPINLPKSLKSLGNTAFGDNTSTSITLPANLENFGPGPFNAMNNLEEFIVDKDNPYLYTPSTDMLIKKGANNNEDILISYLSKAETLVIPEGVKTIEGKALVKLSFKTLHLPSTLTIIEKEGIYSNTSLTTIYITAEVPPTLFTDSFVPSYNLASIYVPTVSVDAYKAAANWTTFSDKIKDVATAP